MIKKGVEGVFAKTRTLKDTENLSIRWITRNFQSLPIHAAYTNFPSFL